MPLDTTKLSREILQNFFDFPLAPRVRYEPFPPPLRDYDYYSNPARSSSYGPQASSRYEPFCPPLRDYDYYSNPARSSSYGPQASSRNEPFCPPLKDYKYDYGANPARSSLYGSQASSRNFEKAAANEFKVMLNVKHFQPDEIEVKIVDGFVVVHGKHEEQVDEHGFVAREFTRRYKMPDDIEAENLTSNLTKDGILTIQAPRKVEPQPNNERIVPMSVELSASEMLENMCRITREVTKDL